MSYAECVLRSGKCGHQIYEEIAKNHHRKEGALTVRIIITPPPPPFFFWLGGGDFHFDFDHVGFRCYRQT